ncbi:hypothetical protein SARC_03640 [Sphaeroforma arctica JP610]|uniref:Uncharacterized protein n=1 Tax=Sphaeroforma arctica JP610 TaxID=667725 RepID=A0A0L0G5C9_9EUKA|nr:hypothetical protein SARC_03640 [Sphaeroforma arctica JP610]KNC84119.1 hypothetical protein SARC_03640 [Sphaeroforma arctica JP610]|eukprot:XP_014158021.1 hypothetical protein SARC_03640 [Sphaeroforma arctica JP610]
MDIKSLTEDAKSDTTAERFDLQALWTRVQDEKDTTATLGAPEASALGEMIGQRLIQHLALNLTFKEVAAEYVREKIRNSDIFGLKVVTDVAVLSGDMELDRLKLFNVGGVHAD